MLPQGRLRSPIGKDQAVQAEIAIVRLIAEVATVSPPPGAVGQVLDKAVVPLLPDEPTLQPGRRLDRIPILGQGAVAVAHRV